MRTRCRRLKGLLGTLAVALVVAAAPNAAHADAIPSAPKDCPRGKVGVSSHRGAECVLEAPKDCPAGWRGSLGGTCVLAPCTDDNQCQTGEACVEHSVCLEAVRDDSYDYGEDEREEQEKQKHGEAEPARGRLLQSPALLAGPPMPRKVRPVPIYRYDAVNLCSADVACAAPRTCQAEKLCVPKGARAVAYRGTNIDPMRVARKTATPLTSSVAPPTEMTAPPIKHGCAGCAAAAGDSSSLASGAAIAGIGALAAALTARRRRRARTSR